jgi:hypothetical protein
MIGEEHDEPIGRAELRHGAPKRITRAARLMLLGNRKSRSEAISQVRRKGFVMRKDTAQNNDRLVE